MGATNIIIGGNGINMHNAFKALQDDAREEYGSDYYNGTISNCDLVKDVTNRRKDFKTEDAFIEWIDNEVSKGEAYGFCTSNPITNSNRIKTVVTNYPQKGTRKWITLYIAIERFNGNAICEDKSQTECIKKARAAVEKILH